VRVTVLGSGTSSGVPRIGGPDGRGDWGKCDPAEPRNRRRRPSLLIDDGPTRILIDTGADLRAQLLDAGIGRVDAVLYTHDHADHTHGIDELRQLFHNSKQPVDCYADIYTRERLLKRFGYVFEGGRGYPATCNLHVLPPELKIGSLTIRHFRQPHGNIDSLGFRFDNGKNAMAYSTDIKSLLPVAELELQQLDLWIVDALRPAPHPTHSHLAQTVEWIERLRPHRAVLTHMDNSMDYATLRRDLPPSIEPGYDGMTIDLGSS